MNSRPELYPHYATLGRDWGPTLAEDFAAAGALMWAGAAMMLVPAVLLTVAAWMRDDDRKTSRREQRQGGVRRAERDREAWLIAQAERKTTNGGVRRGKASEGRARTR
jgi:cytochrome c oxidase assembly factor CtaG